LHLRGGENGRANEKGPCVKAIVLSRLQILLSNNWRSRHSTNVMVGSAKKPAHPNGAALTLALAAPQRLAEVADFGAQSERQEI
jgi:hypothetical protein